MITAGFPFVALGLIASRPAIGILGPEVLDRLRPVLHFGLGWLGFIIGAQLDIRVLDRVPKRHRVPDRGRGARCRSRSPRRAAAA